MTTTHERPEALLHGGTRYLAIPVAFVGLVAVVLALSLVVLVLPTGPSTMGEQVATADTGRRLFVVVTLLALQLSVLQARPVDRVGAAAVVAAAIASVVGYFA